MLFKHINIASGAHGFDQTPIYGFMRAGSDAYPGRGVRRALDYLTPYADAAREWPHQQINEMENARRDLAYLLRRASIAYREARYEESLEKHLSVAAAQQRWQLLWPR